MFYLSVFPVPMGFRPIRSGTAKVCGVSRPLLARGGSVAAKGPWPSSKGRESPFPAALAITLCSLVRRAGRPAPFRDVLRSLVGLSALTLLVARVVADHHHTTVPANNLALVADLLDARLNLHSSNLFNRRLDSLLPNLWWMSWPRPTEAAQARANIRTETTDDKAYVTSPFLPTRRGKTDARPWPGVENSHVFRTWLVTCAGTRYDRG